MKHALRVAAVALVAAAGLALGTGAAMADPGPGTGPEWSADAPGTGPEWSVDAANRNGINSLGGLLAGLRR